MKQRLLLAWRLHLEERKETSTRCTGGRSGSLFTGHLTHMLPCVSFCGGKFFIQQLLFRSLVAHRCVNHSPLSLIPLSPIFSMISSYPSLSLPINALKFKMMMFFFGLSWFVVYESVVKVVFLVLFTGIRSGIGLDYVHVDPPLLCIERSCLDPWSMCLSPYERSLCRLLKHQCYLVGVRCILLLMPLAKQ